MFDDIPADHQPQELPLPQLPPLQPIASQGQGKTVGKFPVSKKAPPVEEQPPVFSSSDLSEEESSEECEVNRIYRREIRFDQKRGVNCWFYEVHFKGENSKKHNWISEYDCTGCQELIDDFLENNGEQVCSKLERLKQQLETTKSLIVVKQSTIDQLESIPTKSTEIKSMIRGHKSHLCRLKQAAEKYEREILVEEKKMKEPLNWLNKLKEMKSIIDEMIAQYE